MVEQLTLNQLVGGSSPPKRTDVIYFAYMLYKIYNVTRNQYIVLIDKPGWQNLPTGRQVGRQRLYLLFIVNSVS